MVTVPAVFDRCHCPMCKSERYRSSQPPPSPAPDYSKMIEENLTSTQARCTELLLENRELRKLVKKMERALEERGPQDPTASQAYEFRFMGPPDCWR